MRHSPASISRGFGNGVATAASTPLGGMDPAEKRGGSGDPGRRRTGEQPWPHRPRAAGCHSQQEGWGCRARATAAPGPRPALPFSPSGEKGEGIERLGAEGHTGGRRLCEPGASGARWARRGCCCGARASGCARRAAGVRRAPPAAAANAAAAAGAKTGLRSAQLLIIPARISLLRKHSARAGTARLSPRLVWVGQQFRWHSDIPSPKFSLLRVPTLRPPPPPAAYSGRQRLGGRGSNALQPPDTSLTLCVQDPGAAGRGNL